LFADAIARGEIRTDLDARFARLLVMGALNWAAEWWDSRRGSVDTVVETARILVRNGLSPAPPVNRRPTKASRSF
jgi:TetR/AcrR family transcriptional regulator, cholesterol catabolism regulator